MSETACRRCSLPGRGCPADFEGRRAEGKADDGCRQRRPHEAGPGCSGRIDLSPKGKSMANADGVEGRYRVRGAWPALRGVRSAACAVRYIRIPGLVYLTPLSYPIRFWVSTGFVWLIQYWNQQLATIGLKHSRSCPEVYPQRSPGVKHSAEAAESILLRRRMAHDLRHRCLSTGISRSCSAARPRPPAWR